MAKKKRTQGLAANSQSAYRITGNNGQERNVTESDFFGLIEQKRNAHIDEAISGITGKKRPTLAYENASSDDFFSLVDKKRDRMSSGMEKLWNTALKTAQAKTQEKLGTFQAGSTQDINDRVAGYKAQQKTYGEEKKRYNDWAEELSQLQAQARWQTGKDLAANQKRQQEIQTQMAHHPAVKPNLPILAPGDYGNRKAAASGTSGKDWDALAAALAGMEKEQQYWEEARKRYQPGSRDLADAQSRYNEKYTAYAKQYEQLGGKMPGGQTVVQQRRLKARLEELQTALADTPYSNRKQWEAISAEIEETENALDAIAGKQKTESQTAQHRTAQQGEDERTYQEELSNEWDRLLEYQDLAAAQEATGGAGEKFSFFTKEDSSKAIADINAARDRRNQVFENYQTRREEQQEQERAEAQERLKERQEAAESYRVYDDMPDFRETVEAEKAKEPNRKDDPVGYARKNLSGMTAFDDSETRPTDGQVRYLFMSAWEVDRYYYLLGKQGKDAAMQYLDDLEITLDKRVQDYKNEYTEILYGTSNIFGKVGLNAARLLAKPVADVFSAAADVKGTLTGKYNPYSPGHAGTNFVDTTTGVTARDIYTSVNDPVWSPILSNTYQAVMSAGDSFIGTVLLGKGYTALMGASAASQKAKELYENGASDTQIGLGAVASGLIEMATEKYSIEYFTEHFLEGDITGFKDWAKKTLIQALNEGSEEVASEIANNVADALIQGANSDNSREVAKLMQKGIGRREAVAQVIKNRAIDVFWAGYGGAMAGGVMGGIGGGLNWAEKSSRQRATGRQILQNEGAQQLLREYIGLAGGQETGSQSAGKKPGLFASTEEKLRAAAERMAAQTVEQYRQMNGFQRRKAEGVLGRIYEQQVQQQADKVDTEIREAFRAAAEKELEGQAEDPKAAAEAVTKQAFGETLTAQDEAALGRKPENQTSTAAESQSQQNEEADAQTDTGKETAAQAAQQPEGTNTQTDTEGKAQVQQPTAQRVNAREIIEKVQSSRAFQALTEEKTTGLLRTVGLAADEDADMNPKNIQKQRAIVAEAAKSYADPEAVMDDYRDGQDAERFLRNYDIAYRNGETGMIGRYSTKSREITRDMTENQILKAHEAGRKAAGYEGEAAEGSVRTGEKWNDMQNPGRKAPGVAEGTAAGEAGQEAGKGTGSFAAGQKVSAEMLGITGGTDEKNLTYRAPEQWNADERAAAAIAKEQGLNITIVQGGSIKTGETADGVKRLVKSRALVEGDTMIVRSDDPTMSAEQLARHEATHKRIEKGEVQLGSTVRQLLKKYSPAQIREIIHLYAEAYGNVNMNAAQVLEEIVCDAMAEMNAFATEQMERVAGEVGRFLRDVQKAAQGTALEGGQKKNAREGVKRSIAFHYDYMKSFGEQLEDFKNGIFPERDSLLLGGTPRVLQKIGLPQIPMVINQQHVGAALNGSYKGTQQEILDHCFTLKEFATLPQKIADPIAIIQDKRTGKKDASSSVVDVIVEMTAKSGKQVLCAVQVGSSGHINGIRMDTNKVATVHGNADAIARIIDAIQENEQGNAAVYYINNKKTTNVIQRAGNPIPGGLKSIDGFVHSISEDASVVKSRIKKATETQQFKRWFGDWQNDPAHASKVVNADGTPLVMYHGTRAENGDFTVFDYSKAVKKGGIGLKALGKGNYFTSTPLNGSERYGSRVISAYLDIKNPFDYDASSGGGVSLAEQVANKTGIDTSGMNHDTLQNKMRELGYDGVIEYKRDGSIGITVTFDSNQIKSATDNIGTFDKNNPDIRYSRELETIEELKQQNELLKKQVDYWHSQTAVTVGERGADKEEVKKLARQLRRDYGSQTEVSDYLPELQWLADNRQNKKARFSDMMQTAENVARQVLDGCRVNVNEEQMETMKELKKFLRGRYINVDDSLKEDIGDFGDFKKLNRALHFREDGSGTGVDSLWLELQDQFGKGLFPEDVQNPADQIRHIADTVGTMEAQWVNPYDADMELTVQQMTNDVMAKTLNLNRMEGTRADKAAEQATKELTYLLEKGRKRELRRIEGAQQTAQRQSIRGMAEKFKRMALKPGKGDTQHAPQQLISAVTEFCEIFNDSEIRRAERQRATLEERTKAFDEAVKSEGGGSAEEYRVILTTRQRIDKMEAALSRLKGIYAEMQNNQYDTVYEDSVVEMLGQLSGILRGKDIYNLSGADLGKVKDTMTALMYSVTNANKAFSLGKDKLISRTAQDWAAGMRQVDHKAAGWRTLARRYEMWQMTPDTWFNYSCGYAKGNVGQEIQKAFVRGEERMMEVQREYYQMYREFTESKEHAKELRSLLNEQKKKRVFWGLHDMAGNEVKTSRGIMLQAYMLLCQKDSFESLQLGGFSLPDQDVYYSGNIKGAFGDMDEGTMFSESGGASYRDLQHDRDVLLDKLTELGKQMQTTPEGKKAALLQEVKEAETQVKDIQREMKGIADRAGKKLLGLKDNIEGQLTPLERQLVERAHDWYSHTGLLMADVFEQMYGYRPMLIDGYTPIHRDADTIKTDIRDMAGAAKAFNLENSSFTIDRVKNAQPILLTDFFWELNSQKEKMSRYVGFAQVQKDFGRIWKTRVSSNGMTINKLVAAKFGTGDTGFGVSGTKYVENYIMDIAGGRKSEDVLGDLYGHYAAATLRLNPRVAVSQAASIPTAASVVGWKSMAAGFAKGLPKAGSTRFRNDLAARNVWFWQRYRGEGGSTELSDIRMKGGVIEKIANSSVGKKLFNWCQEVDVFSTGSIMWYAAEDYVKTTRGLTAGMDGFESAVNEVYTDIIRKSQPNYTTTERADLLRDSRAHMKLLTMFKTQSSQNLNLLLEANGEFIRMKQDLKNGRNGVTAADLKAAGTKLANASTGVFLGGTAAFVALRTIVNFIMGMVNPYRDKDTDEVTMEGTIKGMGKEMLSSLAGTVAMGGQVYDLVMSVVSGDSYYGLSDSAIASISGLLENTQKVIANALDEDKEITGAQLWKMANSWCQVLGIPSGNAKKIYDMLEMYVTGVRDGTLGQYPSDKTSSNQYRERVVQAVLGGETERADDALAILFAKSGGDTDEEIKKDIASGMRTYLKHLYEKGEVSDTEAEKIMAYTGTDDPKGTLERWDFLLEHPEMEASRVSDNLVAAYNQRGDINEDVFLAAWEFAKNAKGDKDSKGKTVSGSKKKKVVAYVQKLSLTRQQKKRLYELLDVGSTKDTPW